MNPPARQDVRILVVEDSSIDYEFLLQRLQGFSLAVEARRVEDEAGMRQALRDAQWDLVISDHHLPRFDSGAALAALRSVNSDIPFIIVSGAIGEEVAVEAMQRGADDYIMKANMARLVPAVERSLRVAAERRAKREAEAAARESERRIGAISANVPGIVIRIHYEPGDGSISFPWVSGASIALCGHSAEALRANSQLLLDCLGPGSARLLREAVAAAAEPHGALRWEGKVGGDGDTRWWLLSAAPDAGTQAPIAWDGIIIDITQEQQALERLSELAEHIESAKEAERAAIARELHDEMGSLLSALKAGISWMTKRFSSEPEASARLREADRLVAEVLAVSKRIARSLRPAILEEGVVAALEWQTREFEKHSGIACRYRTNSEELDLPESSATTLFRILQEALTNVAKHARATRVDVQLFATGDEVTLEVQDDGVGARESELYKAESFGVRGMRERVRHLGGWLEMSGSAGRGTTLMLSIPRHGKEKANP